MKVVSDMAHLCPNCGEPMERVLGIYEIPESNFVCRACENKERAVRKSHDDDRRFIASDGDTIAEIADNGDFIINTLGCSREDAAGLRDWLGEMLGKGGE